MDRPTPPAHPAKPAHARRTRRDGPPAGRGGLRRLVLGVAVVAIAAAGTVFGVTRSAGAGHDAARKGRHATTTTTSAAPALSPTTSRPAPVSSVPSSPGSGTAKPTEPSSPVKPFSSPSSTVAPSPVQSAPAACTPVAAPGGAYAVGDSVMIDAQVPLQECVPNIQVNAAVSRQWSDGETILRGVMAGASPPAAVVVALGTNGPITAADFDAMMSILPGASRVVFVTVHVDKPWQNQVNGVLSSGVARYPKAVLADWESLAAQHPEWFYSDGTHLPIGGPGAQALAALIASKV